MSFWGDERSQSVQVGAIILFGFLVIGISSYQVTVVPSQNEGIEFNHNQRVTDEMSDVRNAIIQTGENGGTQPQSITLGTSFPSRTLFVNPPPATGQIQTVGTTKESYNVTITNGTAQSREVAHFWNGSQKTFPTGLLIYEPNYREFTGAGNVTYGHSLLYKKFDNGNAITLTDQSIVEGRTISLVMLNGSLSESGVGSYTVRPRGLSVSKTTVTLRSDDIVNITLPTRLSESKWRETVGDENSVYLNYTNLGDRQFNLVNISLKPDTTYELRLAKVGVGNLPSDAEQDTGPAYITDVEGLSDSLRNNSEDRVVVEVRDKYNNPVSGVQVNVTTDENATVKNVTETGADGLATQTTDAEGRVTVLVTPNATDANVTVNASIFDGDDPPENVTFEATTRSESTNTGDSTSDTTTNSTGAWPLKWKDPEQTAANSQRTAALSDCDNESCTLDASQNTAITLEVSTAGATDGTAVSFSVNNSSVAALSSTSNDTNADGNATTALNVQGNGVVKVVANSGGGTDVIRVRVENYVPGVVYEQDGAAATPPGGTVSSALQFNVTNRLSDDITVTDIYVDPSDTGIKRLDDPSTGEGKFESEFHVEVSGGPYTTDFAGGESIPFTFDLSTAAVENDEHQIGSGDKASYTLYEFLDGADNPVDMTDKEVKITLYYTNDRTGETGSMSFVVNDDGDGAVAPNPGVAYVDGGTLKTVDSNRNVKSYSVGTPQVLGPMSADLDGDGLLEIPFITGSDLKMVDIDGQVTTLDTTNSLKTSNSRIGVGDLDDDGDPAVFYVASGSIYKVEPNGDESTPTELEQRGGGPPGPVSATAIAGVTNLDGGNPELVFLDGNSLNYATARSGFGDVDSPVTMVTGVKSGSVGSPGDFDGDSITEVPYRDQSSPYIRFADTNGEDGDFDGTNGANEPRQGSLATFDFDKRGEPAVVYVNNNNQRLTFVYADGGATDPTEITADGSPITADTTYGAAAIEAPDGDRFVPVTDSN
jgi:hypothetical protein